MNDPVLTAMVSPSPDSNVVLAMNTERPAFSVWAVHRTVPEPGAGA